MTARTNSVDQKPKAGINKWGFSGKITKKDVKYSKSGNLFASLQITVPAKNEKFATKLWLKAFKEKAQEIEDNIKVDQNYSFWGYVSNSSYEKDGQKVYATDFIINGFVEADEAATEPVAGTEEKVPF